MMSVTSLCNPYNMSIYNFTILVIFEMYVTHTTWAISTWNFSLLIVHPEMYVHELCKLLNFHSYLLFTHCSISISVSFRYFQWFRSCQIYPSRFEAKGLCPSLLIRRVSRSHLSQYETAFHQVQEWDSSSTHGICQKLSKDAPTVWLFIGFALGNHCQNLGERSWCKDDLQHRSVLFIPQRMLWYRHHLGENVQVRKVDLNQNLIFYPNSCNSCQQRTT